MFTGIIEEKGILEEIRREGNSFTLRIHARKVLEGTRIGDSINTDGICLTVTRMTDNSFSADVMPETRERTTLKESRPGTAVNLERALRLSDRLGGHLVSGHIDGTGTIMQKRRDQQAILVTISIQPAWLPFVVEKGSIAVDGISLTIIHTDRQSVTVGLIPHTGEHTTLVEKPVGASVNIECDLIAKYVDNRMKYPGPSEGLTMKKLQEEGYW